jgi:hypothetical protein
MTTTPKTPKTRPTVVQMDEVVARYCEAVARESGAEFKYLTHSARELRAALSPFGFTKAWLVSSQLIIAGRMARSASGKAVATYAKFLQVFGPDLVAEKQMKSKAVTVRKNGAVSFKFK